MLERNKDYGYEELKKIFDEIRMEVVMTPFHSDEDDVQKGEFKFIESLIALSTIATLEKKLFGEEE